MIVKKPARRQGSVCSKGALVLGAGAERSGGRPGRGIPKGRGAARRPFHGNLIVTNMARPAENVVAFYNKRGTCERWIKEGKGATRWTRLSCPRASRFRGFSPTFALPHEVVRLAHSQIGFRQARRSALSVRRPRWWRAALARTSEETLYHSSLRSNARFPRKRPHYSLEIDFVKHIAPVAFADEKGARP